MRPCHRVPPVSCINARLRSVLSACLSVVALWSIAVPGLAYAQKVRPLFGGSAVITVSQQGTAVNAAGGVTTSYSFGLQNTGTGSASVTFTATCSGAVFNCSASPSSASMAANSTRTVTVTYSTNATGTGTVTLDAKWPSANDAQGWINVTLPSAKPSITASLNPQYTAENVSTNNPSFTIHNNGNTAAAYSLTATCTGNIVPGSIVPGSCSVSSPSASVAAGSTTGATVNFTTGPASSGNGSVMLTATSPYGETSSQTVTVIPLSENVTVGAGSGSATIAPGASQPLSFTIAATGNNTSPITYTLTASCSGAVSCSTTPSPGSVTITPGSPAGATVTATAAGSPAGGTGTVSLLASYTNAWGQTYSNQNSYSVTVPAEQSATATAPTGPVYDEVNSTVTRVFTIHNPNAVAESYTWTATCGQAATCSGQSGTAAVPASGTASVNVTYTTATTSPGSGTVSFTAGDAAGSASASLSVVLNDYTPGVVPVSGTVGTLVSGQAVTDTFNVRNQGNQEAIYVVTPSCNGAISPTCSLANSMQRTNGVDLLPGATAAVPVQWTASGSATTSHVSLSASFTNAHGTWQNTGTRTLTMSTWTPSITANAPPTGGFPPDATGLIQAFTVANTGTASATYSFTVACTGAGAFAASCVVVTPAPGSIAAGASAVVQVRFNSGDAGTSANIVLTATASPYSDSGTASISVNQFAPSISTSTPSLVEDSNVSETRTFMVHNPNAVGATYSWNINCHGAATCTASSGTIAVAAQDSTALSAPYTAVGSPNATGAIVATASNAAESASDSITVRIKSFTVVVTSVGSPDTLAAGAAAVATFTVKNTGLDSMAYVFTASCDNTAATLCQQPPTTPVLTVAQFRGPVVS